MTFLNQISGIKISILIILVFCTHSVLYSQEPESKIKTGETEITDKIENVAESTEATLDYTELVDDLNYLQKNPLNVNYATDRDLQKLGFLNDMQIFNLLAYRETYGNLVTIYELQSIEGFDRETIQRILPYIFVSNDKPKIPLSFKGIMKYGRHQLILRYQRILQEQRGYSPIDDSTLYESPNSRYIGSPDKVYLRYGFNYFNKVRVGFIAEKDAGEAFLTSKVNDSIHEIIGSKLKNGFDFYSGHLSLCEFGFLKSLTIGDYQLEYGQGLTLWTGLAFGKSSDAVNLKRFARGVKPNTSANENRYFRGIATTIAIKNLDFSAFYSSHKVDANLVEFDTLDNENGYISSLQESGLHRTPRELNYKKAINFTAFGGNLTYRHKRFNIGVTSYYSKLGSTLQEEPNFYNQFDFSGSENLNTGFDYSLLFNKVNFFGEVSMSKNGGFAQLHGFTANPHPLLSLTLLYRNYQKDYQNFYSNAFAEGSYNTNEKGLYAGLKFQVYRRWILSAYIDNFSFPWLKYRVDAPSKGNDYLIQLENTHSDNVFFYVRFRQKNKQINSPSGEKHLNELVNTRKNYYRFHIEYAVSPSVVLKNRVEYVQFREGNYYKGSGYLIYQDIVWKSRSDKISLAFRYSLFDTDTYDERIYAYENDVLYAFSVPAYYYKGNRGYLIFNYKVTRKISCWIRFAHTYCSDRSTFGSGLDEIDGNSKSEIKIQMRIKI